MQTMEESTQNKLIEKMTDSVNALNVNFARVEGKIRFCLRAKKRRIKLIAAIPIPSTVKPVDLLIYYVPQKFPQIINYIRW